MGASLEQATLISLFTCPGESAISGNLSLASGAFDNRDGATARALSSRRAPLISCSATPDFATGVCCGLNNGRPPTLRRYDNAW
jgi:hypothetical protein